MFGKKKESKPRTRTAGSLAQFGLFEVPDNFDDIGNMDADYDDEDLEAELAALSTNNNGSKKPRRNGPKPLPTAELDKMINESMKDIALDDEELSGDEDDPELLNELKMIAESDTEVSSLEEALPDEPESHEEPEEIKEKSNGAEEMIKVLEERLVLYKTAETKAKTENEMSKARRFGRGIKTLNEMLMNARAGKVVNEAEIPPLLPPSATGVVPTKIEDTTVDASPSPSDTPSKSITMEPAAPTVPIHVDEEKLNILKKRQQEYRIAAVAWKKAGNKEEALKHLKIAKQFDEVIPAVSAGETIDLSDMPPPPSTPSLSSESPTPSPQEISQEKEENEIQTTPSTDDIPTPVDQQTSRGDRVGEDLESALKERLEVYRRTKTIAESEGNSSKARRYGRICKQFEDAIKLHARGKAIPLDELPTPPGFPPLVTPAEKVTNSTPIVNKQESPTEPVKESSLLDNDTPKSEGKKPPAIPPRTNQAKHPNQKPTSRAAKQMALLQQRQVELKQAALRAKQEGDLDLARDYLRQAKGIQPLIEASMSGLPVDMNSIPLSPVAKMELNDHGLNVKSDDNSTSVASDIYLEEAQGTNEQIYENLEAQLIKQIKWCLSTRDHSKALGDVPGYNRWERLALGYTRDLDMLRVRKRDSLPPPLHHYEIKTYPIVQSCTDLNDSDIEISIIRGINYAREADTYVIFEFPFPSDSPPTDRTSTIKDSRNPEYEGVFPLTGIIDRSSRQCQRAFKRHALKCQVWAKGGFFRSDSLLGTVTIKLQPLETQCTLHDSFPLMEGRKATGGKLEVKMRLRNPILAKQIEQVTDKWLYIDH